MNLGISSLAFIVEFGSTKKYESLGDLLLDSTKECFNFAEKYDIKIVEIVLDPPVIFTDGDKEKFLELTNSFPKIKTQVHGPFLDLCLCSHNSFISKATVDTYIETAKFCEDIRADILTIHPGLANFLVNSIREFNKVQLIESVKKLLDTVKNLELSICMENMPKKVNILTNENEIDQFFRDLNREDIFLTWDTSHSWTCDIKLDNFWDKFYKIIKNIHLVDNYSKDTDTHPRIGSGKINFEEIFSFIQKYKYTGPLIVELSYAKDLPLSLEYISRFI